MSTRRLATSSRKAFEVLRYQGIAAADGYAQISAIATSLGPDHALLFAEPAHDITGASTDWYTAAEGDIRPFADLSPDEQERTQARVAELSDDIRELAEQLKNSQEGSKVIRGNVLALALRFPDASHIYLVGSQPVVTCWGAAPAHAESVVPAGGLLLESAPLAMVEPAPESTPEVPASQKGRTWLKVLLLFFLFLLLLALLLFGAFLLFAPKEYAPEYLRDHMPDWFTRWTPEDVHTYVPESLKKYLPDGLTGDASKDPESAETPTSPDEPAPPLDDGNKEDDPQRELERLTRRLLERAKTGDQEPAPSVQTPPGETPNPAPTHLAPGERPPRPTPVVVPTPYAEPEEPKSPATAPAETPTKPAPEVPAPVETPAQPMPTVPAPVETPPQPAPAVPGQPAPMLPVPAETPENPAPAVPAPAETPAKPAPVVPSPAETPSTPAPMVPNMVPPPGETPTQPTPAVPAPGTEPAKPMPVLMVPVPIVVPAPAEKPFRPEPAPGEPPSIGDMLPTTPDPPPGTLPPDPTPMPGSVPRSSLDGTLFAREAGATGCSGLVAGSRVVGFGDRNRAGEPFQIVAETHVARSASAGDLQYAPRRFERASVLGGKADGCPAPDAVTPFSPTGRFSAPRRIV